MQREMLLEILKDGNYLDYDILLRKYLFEYHKDKLAKMNWNIEELY